MRKYLAIAATALAAWTGAVSAQTTTVVELYTSQGCSSCPPADALLHELAKDDDVIALALHVDYWDYIGWKDQFANPAHTERQKRYAKVAGARTIYTPQMIIGGQDHVIGNRPAEVASQLTKHMMKDPAVAVSAGREGQTARISLAAVGETPAMMMVQVVTYMPSATVDITRGENAGRVMEYANIVTSWSFVEDWDGTEPVDLVADIPKDDPAVVIVQTKGLGPILAAARIE